MIALERPEQTPQRPVASWLTRWRMLLYLLLLLLAGALAHWGDLKGVHASSTPSVTNDPAD
jgi:hypothetical protein